MKRLLAAVAVVLSFQGVASAAVSTYQGTAKSNAPFEVPFTIATQGAVVTATFAPKNSYYVLSVYAEATPNAFKCSRSTNGRWGQEAVGSLTCSMPNIAPGSYVASFAVGAGTMDVTLTIDGDTG